MLIALLLAVAARGDGDLAELLARLAAPDRPAAEAAWRELAGMGEPAARAALDGFESAPLFGRRARAALVREAGGAELIGPAAQRLADPDAEVRRALLEFLGDPRLHPESAGDARERALERAALLDAESSLRELALSMLARLEGPAATAALDRLIDALPAPEDERAATLFADRPAARARVVERVQQAFAGAAAPGDAVLAALLARGYGRALAELPSGGAGARDLVPFALGLRHPAAAVRDGATAALDRFVARARLLGDVPRAERLLDALLLLLPDEADLPLRRAEFALEAGSDPRAALAPARALARRLSSLPEPDRRRALASAWILEGAAQVAAGAPAEAEEPLARASQVLERLAQNRVELAAPELAGAQVQALETRAAVECWRALALLAGGAALDDSRVLERARAVHELSLRSQLARTRGDTDPTTGSLDEVLEHRLGPFQLLFQNERSGGLARARRLELAMALCNALAAVAPREMPGFAGPRAGEPRLRDAIEDPARAELLSQYMTEELRRLRTAQFRVFAAVEMSEEERLARSRQLAQRIDELEGTLTRLIELRSAARPADADDMRELDRLRLPSEIGLTLVADLRQDGRALEGRELSERMLAALEGWEYQHSAYGELRTARVETAIGNAWTDQGEGLKADEMLNRALARLEGVERGVAGYEVGPEWIDVLRARRSDVLTSLAVNANVKLRDPEKALAYFERAMELRREDDFSRVMLACYRARAGRASEARALLRDVPHSPFNDYNLACTYALLGEKDAALDFLRRELLENLSSEGARARQKEWARGDPDLEALHGDSRFEALVR